MPCIHALIVEELLLRGKPAVAAYTGIDEELGKVVRVLDRLGYRLFAVPKSEDAGELNRWGVGMCQHK